MSIYVAPENAALGDLIRELPVERRAMWQNPGTDWVSSSRPLRPPAT